MTSLDKFYNESKFREKDNKAFYNRLKARPPKNLDLHFHQLHEEVFEKTDCLSCANCCKTTSPIFYDRDVERAAKALRMKPGAFTEKYLRLDEDNDMVLKTAPCPFLDGQNYCSIYADRPAACREYPHTDRKKMYQVLDLTFKNTLVCPAVLKITDRLRNLKIV